MSYEKLLNGTIPVLTVHIWNCLNGSYVIPSQPHNLRGWLNDEKRNYRPTVAW
jgi:hypothetical protein